MAEWIAAHPYWTVAIPLLSVYFIANIILLWTMVVRDKMLELATTGEKIIAPVVIVLFGSLIAIFMIVYDKKDVEDEEEKGD